MDFACTVPGIRRAAIAATRTSCCSIRTPRRSKDGSTGTLPSFRFAMDDDGRIATTSRASALDSAPARPPLDRRRHAVSTGATTGAPTARCTRRRSTSCTSRASRRGCRRCRPSLRGTYAGLAHPASHRLPDAPRRQRRRADAGASVRARRTPAQPRAAQLLGLQLDRVLRAAQRVFAAAGSAAQQVREFKADGQGAARRRHRGHPRCRLQPHGRGQSPRADAVVQGPRQRAPITGVVGDEPALLHGLHGHRQQPEHAPPARAAAADGFAALLGARDARRRLPLRPRGDARARAARSRSAVGLLRSDSAGSGRQPGEADRRTVGRRRGRLSGRQLPRVVVGVERQVSATRSATTGAAPIRRSASSPIA